MKMQIINYNGKKYYGNKLRGMCELRSLTKDDAGFHSIGNWQYRKCVKESEGYEVESSVWLFVECYGKIHEVIGYDSGFDNFETCISSGTQIDLYDWFNIDELSKCFLVIDDYFNKAEENRVYLSKEEFIDTVKIFGSENNKK